MFTANLYLPREASIRTALLQPLLTLVLGFLVLLRFDTGAVAQTPTQLFLDRLQTVLPVTRRGEEALGKAFLLDGVIWQARDGVEGARDRIVSEHREVRQTVRDVETGLGRINTDFDALLEKHARLLDEMMQSGQATIEALSNHVDAQAVLLDVSQGAFQQAYVEFLRGSMERRVVYASAQRNMLRALILQNTHGPLAQAAYRWKEAFTTMDISFLTVMSRHLQNGTFGKRVDASDHWSIAKEALENARRYREDHSAALKRLIAKRPSGADEALWQEWGNQLRAMEVARDSLFEIYDEQLRLYYDDAGWTAAPTVAEMNDFDERFAKAAFALSQQEIRAVDASARVASGTKKN